ncbi:hypothetical protein HLV39_02740 [Marinobacter adhaerens]|uniref:Transglutaminase-like domain-containing protein n=1 Tax=Marinobacter adhaerens TaxID=1033846 RepID=A0A851HSH2_9GAMM|nr:hypothetical protein [Marinobacter adhaerens]NWN90416.1 hypothetical protein [Marinobacter adhaerens]
MKGKLESIRALYITVGVVSLVIGLILMSINLYGVAQPIRKPGLGVLDQGQLRFVPNKVWSYKQSMEAINDLGTISGRYQLAEKANEVVNRSLVHVDWNRVDPKSYRQLIPIWENYFLWAIGHFSGLPQFERYHYADYRRNIRRGIGICGDASTILSSVMDRYGIPNRIVSFQGHVIVEYQDENGQDYLLDPDFGVSLGASLSDLLRNPEGFKQPYVKAGYSVAEIDYLFEAYKKEGYSIYEDTYHFMTQRYIFENVSYGMKWLLPGFLVVLPVAGYLFYKRNAWRKIEI